jgi:hypothetical protein
VTNVNEWTAPTTIVAGVDAWNDDAWPDQEPALLYSTLVDWVTHWLIPMYRRNMEHREYAWCPEWWKHPEAVVRLSALWRGFEQRRTQPGDAMSAWLRDHLDHHMPLLMDADHGPLKGCTASKGHAARPLTSLPHIDPPTGLAIFLV